MQDLIRPDASFTPRELFARMQGAWFEPRQGSMWQENAGVTPTTSGGQTIGLLLGLNQQQQLSSELTTNGTFDADVNGWTGINGTLVWDTGRAKITASNTAPICISSGITTVVGAWYVLTATLARGTGTAITGYVAATNNSNGSAAYAEGSATPVIAGTARLVFRATATTTYVYARYDGAVAGQTYFFDDFSLKQIFGNHASQATAANRPTLQYNGNLPRIRHAASIDVLVAAMPNLGSGVFSSAGSVYFATPSGMSALHNQSIGTTYNLPAPNTDIYGIVITPARLAPPLEQRLALYMHRLAGLSDADFFWQEQATDGMEGQLLADDNDTILLRA